MQSMLLNIITVFMVLFAVIDITGNIPIILDLKKKSGRIEPVKATFTSFGLMILFLFIGEPFLGLFGIDINSFAIAGSFILFFLALEMVLGIQFFHHESSSGASIVPIAFPLIAGTGSFTTILSLKSEYATLTILIALTLNMILVYFVLRSTRFFEKLLGNFGIQILKKVFGIILLAIAIKLFISNTGIELPHGK